MAPEVLYAPTDDGWNLALHHWAARGRERRRHPVLMIHGPGGNRRNIDLDEHHSVARAARDRGFDVYVLELRGAGLSRPPGGRDRTLFEWGFGEHDARDVPAAVAKVLAHSGAQALHGVGHSMGGMLLYALGARRHPALRSITAVGSPLVSGMRLGRHELRLLRLVSRFAPEKRIRRVPLRRLMFTAGRFVPLSSRLVDGVLLNVSNCEPEVISRVAREGMDDVPIKLLAEMMHQIANGHGTGGPFGYEAQLGRLEAPVLALSGSSDRVAPPSSVEAAVARIASHDVRYREVGKRGGYRADYGHADLLVGRAAPEEVFPSVLDFLTEMD